MSAYQNTHKINVKSLDHSKGTQVFKNIPSLSMIRQSDDHLETVMPLMFMVPVTFNITTKSCSVASLMSSSTTGICSGISLIGVPELDIVLLAL